MNRTLSRILIPLVLVVAGCGGSGSAPTPPSGSFSNASLHGQYAFLMHGLDASSGAYMARIGSFTADGDGNITAGLVDALGLSSGQPALAIPLTAGAYQIDDTGRGTISLVTASGTLRFSMALQSASNGFLVETDLTATSSGTFRLQTASDFSTSSLSNHYAFRFSGVTFQPSTAAPISLLGEFNADGSGAITGGLMDTNNGNLSPSGATAISSGACALDSSANGAAFGRGTMTFGGYTFAFYIVDSSHLVVLEEDTLGGTSGEALLQSASVPTQNSQLADSFVFLITGASLLNNRGPVARVARFTLDGNGGLGSISLDDSNNGNYTHVPQGSNISSASYAMDTANAGTGRGAFTFTDSNLGTLKFVFYLLSPTQGFVQNTGTGVIGDGPFSAQSGGPFALSGLTGNFVSNWSGVELGANIAIPFQEDFVGQYALSNTSGTNIAGAIDYVELGLSGNPLSSTPVFTGVALGGTLSITGDGTANNHYKFAVNGSPSMTVNFQAYFVNPSTVYMVTSDNNRTTAGIVTQQ